MIAQGVVHVSLFSRHTGFNRDLFRDFYIFFNEAIVCTLCRFLFFDIMDLIHCTVEVRRHTPWSCVRCHGCWLTQSISFATTQSSHNWNIQHWCACAVVTREPWNHDNGVSYVWASTAYVLQCFKNKTMKWLKVNYWSFSFIGSFVYNLLCKMKPLKFTEWTHYIKMLSFPDHKLNWPKCIEFIVFGWETKSYITLFRISWNSKSGGP